jgi:hypothetical protein
MIKQTVAAVFVFLLAVAVGTFLSGRNSGQSPAATTNPPAPTTALAPRAFFVDAHETVVGPVVIIAEEPYVDDTQLVVNFDVVTLAPTADAADVEQPQGFGSFLTVSPEDLNMVYLDSWVLTTNGSEIPGTVASPAARSARFEVGSGFDLAAIDGVAISSYALLTPIGADIALAPGNESTSVAPGVTARLLAVTEQANTIVQVELTSVRGFNLDNLRVTGSGPGWLSAVREAEGRPRWNLTFDSVTAPSPIRMNVEGSVWLAVDESTPVTLGASE